MNLEIRNVKRWKGNVLDCYAATVCMPDGKRVNVTYDNLEKNLVVHEGYRISTEELESVMAFSNSYFERLLEEENKASA